MNFHLLGVVVIVSAVNFLATCSLSQEVPPWVEKLKDRESHFIFQTIYGLGLSKPTYRAILQDENGFEYDTLSMLRQSHRELDLSQGQLDEIREIYLDAIEEMKAHPDNSLFAKDQSKLEVLFREAHDDIQAILTEQQLTRLEEIRHRKGVEKVGFARYFSSSHFEGNAVVSEEDREVLEGLTERLESQRKSDTLELLKAANQKLLAQLSEPQFQKFKVATDEKLSGTFLTTPMFMYQADLVGDGSELENDWASNTERAAKLLNLRKTQAALGLSEGQVKQLRELSGEGAEAKLAVLQKDQLDKLNQISFPKDLKRRGTVKALSAGRLAQVLMLSQDESQAIDRAGRRIFSELCDSLTEANRRSLEGELQRLSPQLAELIRSSLGRLSAEASLLPQK